MRKIQGYGELASSEHIVGIMNKLIAESFAVMNAAGYKTFWKNAQEYKDVFYGKLVPDTFAHHPSTLQDIKKGQRTEIDTLNGCILRLGKKYSIPTPTHAIIVELTKGLEDVRCLKQERPYVQIQWAYGRSFLYCLWRIHTEESLCLA